MSACIKISWQIVTLFESLVIKKYMEVENTIELVCLGEQMQLNWQEHIKSSTALVDIIISHELSLKYSCLY